MAVIRDFINGQFRDDETEEIGIGGFTTAARLRENVKRSREVPTTFLEDGTQLSDHIIRNPLVISIQGEVSDVYRRPSPVLQRIRETEAVVGAVALYAPARTQAQLSRVAALTGDVQALIDRADQAIETGQNVARFLGFTGDEGKTNIERFIDFIEGAHYSNALIRIDAPFRTYRNMAITLLDYERDNTTNSVRFNLEAQEVRVAETIFVETAARNPAPATNGQHQGESDKGVQEGEEVPQSFVDSLFERLGI
jgi:hypothetical protein